MPKAYINIHGEASCAPWSKLAFQGTDNSGDIKSLKGLEHLERDIQSGVLKDGDVIQVFARITLAKDDMAPPVFSYTKADGSTVASTSSTVEKEEVPF